MTLRLFFVIMVVSTLAAWLAWIIVLFQIDPAQAGLVGFILFYFSLCLALIGTFCLISLLFQSFFRREVLIFRQVGTSFRQAAFLAALIVVLLFFQSHRLLTWWNAILLVLGATSLELFYLTYSRRRVLSKGRVAERSFPASDSTPP